MRTVCPDAPSTAAGASAAGEGALVGGFLHSLLTGCRCGGCRQHLVVLRTGDAGLFRCPQGQLLGHQVGGVGGDDAVADAQAHDLVDGLLAGSVQADLAQQITDLARRPQAVDGGLGGGGLAALSENLVGEAEGLRLPVHLAGQGHICPPALAVAPHQHGLRAGEEVRQGGGIQVIDRQPAEIQRKIRSAPAC